MSTRSVFTVVGTVVGAYFGNAALGATIGSMVGGYVDPVQVKGPRLTDAQQQTSQDGVPIALTFGVVRIQGNVIASSKLTEHKNKDNGKGGGQETTTYTYTRTFAIGICEGPIEGIRRIWRNGKLVFDARPEVMDRTARIMTDKFMNDHVLYFGGETQIQDSHLQSALGSDSVPAFRGLAYLVGVDEDVTDVAGAVPTYEFEVISKGTTNELNEYVPVGYPDILPFGIAPESRRDPRVVAGEYLYAFWNGSMSPYVYPSLFDAVKAAANNFGHKPYDAVPVSMGWGTAGSSSTLGWNSSDSFWNWQNRGDHFDQRTLNAMVAVPRAQFTSTAEVQGLGHSGTDWPCVYFGEGKWAARFDNTNPGDTPSADGVLASSGVVMYTVDPDLVMDADQSFECDGSAPNTLYHFGDYLIGLVAVPGCSQFIDEDWLPVSGTVGVYVDRYGNYHTVNDCAIVDGSFRQLAILKYTEDGRSFTQAPIGPVVAVGDPQDTEQFWVDAYELAVAEQKIDPGLVYGTDYPVGVAQACLCSVGTAIFEGDVTLAEIVGKLCLRARLDPSEIDVSELTDRVIGFTVATQTNAADTINILAPGFLFDGAEWDSVTHFVKRGHNHIAELSLDDSVETDDPRIQEVRAQDVELPQQIVLSYFDPAADLAVTTQRASRISVTVNATGTDTLQIPVAMTADQAAQVADKLLKDKWASLAGTLSQTLTDEFSYLTPTDVVTVESDGAIFRVRVGEITLQEGTCAYQATQDVQSAYTSNVEGLPPPTPDVGMDLPTSPTLAIYLNLPALRDQDDQVGVYVAATGVAGPWQGALIEVSRDGGSSWRSLQTLRQSSTVGQILTDLPFGSPDVPYEDLTIDVTLTSGTLESVTEAQWFNQQNGAAVGNEIIQYRTATLIGPKTYRLSGIIRGRKNTEPVEHIPGENFCLLPDLYFAPLQRSDLGRTLLFRATSLGTPTSDGIVATFAFTRATSATEWPVTNIMASRSSGNDLSFRWSPRARLGNALTPYQSAFFNGYMLTFTAGSVTKTYASAGQTFAYTAAMQTADFGSVPGSIAYTVAATNTITGAGDSRGGMT
jgi:hypothetical protein